MTKSKYADIRVFSETFEKKYEEHRILKQIYRKSEEENRILKHVLKKAQEKIKCLEKNAKKTPPVRRKRMKIDRPRKVINEKVKVWAIRTRARELGLKNIKTWKALYQRDPCVSNEREFYKSYLENFNTAVLIKKK
jgi:hypothetical protein